MARSPELGSIEVAGPVGPAASQTNDLLGQMGAEAGQLIADGVNRKRINDADKAFNAISEDALNSQSPVGAEEELVGPPTSRGSPEVEMLGNIRTLQAGVNQASGSRKAALELELRRKVEELGNKNPKLRAAYAQELGRFMRVDPEVQAIEMLDAGDANYSAAQAKQLSDLQSRAYGSIASGGLGMDPGETFGDAAFVKEYLYLNSKRAYANQNQLTLEAIQSGEALDARSSAELFQTVVTGTANIVKSGIEGAMDMTSRLGVALKDPTAPGAAESIAEWNNFGRKAVLQDLNRAVYGIEEAFSSIPITQAHTQAYTAAKALRDDNVKALNALIVGVTNDIASVPDAYKAYQVMQQINFERKNPEFVEEARIITEYVPIIDLIDDGFGGEGKIFRNNLAVWMNQDLSGVIGRAEGFTRLGDLPPNPTPQQIQAHLRSIRMDADNPYDTGNNSSKAVRTYDSTDISLKSRDSFLRMATEGAIAPPKAAVMVTSLAGNLDHLLLPGEVEPDAMEQAISDIANPSWIDMARIAAQSNQPASVILLGDKMQQLVYEYSDVRLEGYDEQRLKPVTDGISVAQAVYVDDSDIDKGNVRFMVNTDMIRSQISNDPSRQAQFAADTFGSSRDLAIANAIEAAQVAADRLTIRVNNDLKAMAHASALSQGIINNISYRATWNSTDLKGVFGALPSDETE